MFVTHNRNMSVDTRYTEKAEIMIHVFLITTTDDVIVFNIFIGSRSLKMFIEVNSIDIYLFHPMIMMTITKIYDR